MLSPTELYKSPGRFVQIARKPLSALSALSALPTAADNADKADGSSQRPLVRAPSTQKPPDPGSAGRRGRGLSPQDCSSAGLGPASELLAWLLSKNLSGMNAPTRADRLPVSRRVVQIAAGCTERPGDLYRTGRELYKSAWGWRAQALVLRAVLRAMPEECQEVIVKLKSTRTAHREVRGLVEKRDPCPGCGEPMRVVSAIQSAPRASWITMFSRTTRRPRLTLGEDSVLVLGAYRHPTPSVSAQDGIGVLAPRAD